MAAAADVAYACSTLRTTHTHKHKANWLCPILMIMMSDGYYPLAAAAVAVPLATFGSVALASKPAGAHSSVK